MTKARKLFGDLDAVLLKTQNESITEDEVAEALGALLFVATRISHVPIEKILLEIDAEQERVMKMFARRDEAKQKD